MIKEAMEKIPGGKLLRIKAYVDTKINKVNIIGDFFIHPEESIEEIEKLLSEINADFDESEKIQELKEFVKINKVQLIGLDEESIVRVLKMAVEK